MIKVYDRPDVPVDWEWTVHAQLAGEAGHVRDDESVQEWATRAARCPFFGAKDDAVRRAAEFSLEHPEYDVLVTWMISPQYEGDSNDERWSVSHNKPNLVDPAEILAA